MSKPRKKKSKLPENVEELPDDQVARILFGDKTVDEANRMLEHEPSKPSDKDSK